MIPDHKPARDFIVGHEGGVWVVREGPSELLPRCGGDPEDDPCWRGPRIVDAFDSRGRYLGEGEVPEGAKLGQQTYLRGSLVTGFQGAAGADGETLPAGAAA